jgi:glycerophosphoryl diester phosphodiesterase
MVDVIARQLNIKRVLLKKGKEIGVKLDTKMTKELEAEGFAREFARKVQAERKNKGLKKGEMIKLKVYSPDLMKMLESQMLFLKERTNSSEIIFEKKDIDGKLEFLIKGKKVGVKF